MVYFLGWVWGYIYIYIGGGGGGGEGVGRKGEGERWPSPQIAHDSIFSKQLPLYRCSPPPLLLTVLSLSTLLPTLAPTSRSLPQAGQAINMAPLALVPPPSKGDNTPPPPHSTPLCHTAPVLKNLQYIQCVCVCVWCVTFHIFIY